MLSSIVIHARRPGIARNPTLIFGLLRGLLPAFERMLRTVRVQADPHSENVLKRAGASGLEEGPAPAQSPITSS